MAHRKFRIIDDCPCPDEPAPFVYIVLRSAGMTASSIYRGADATVLLHAHGKRNQDEIHRDFPDISNPSGFSEHDLHDGNGNPLEDWQIGVDSGGNSQEDRDRVEAAARKHGWKVIHHYRRGVEGHHWCFEEKPSVGRNPLRIARIHITRKRLRTR